MKITEKKHGRGLNLKFVLCTAFLIFMILFLQPEKADAFNFRSYTFQWVRADNWAAVILNINYVGPEGGSDSYEVRIADRETFHVDIGFGATFTLEIIPVLKDGTRGDVVTKYIVLPFKPSSRGTISFIE